MMHCLTGNSRLGKNLLLAVAGIALSIAVIFGIANVPILRAQSTASPDVQASGTVQLAVAVVRGRVNQTGRFGKRHRSAYNSHSRKVRRCEYQSENLIAWAYNNGAGFQLSDDRILGGPSWISTEKYDVEAKEDNQTVDRLEKLPPGERDGQTKRMVQSLLADRFKLKVHHETRNLPVYALVVAKNGPKMTETTKEPRVRFRTGEITATAGNTKGIAAMLSRQAPTGCAPPELEGREVRDETGLSGVYDFTLKWAPEPRIPNATDSEDPAPPQASGPSVFTALEEQLGLRLESTKEPADVVVIDHIEEPTPN